MEGVGHVMAALAADESGAAAAEYALIIGAVSVIVVVGALVLGQGLSDFFAMVGNWFNNLVFPAGMAP
ncbi:MAG: Flp family type IVb pilin [Alphaproteobacteria bacterium]